MVDWHHLHVERTSVGLMRQKGAPKGAPTVSNGPRPFESNSRQHYQTNLMPLFFLSSDHSISSVESPRRAASAIASSSSSRRATSLLSSLVTSVVRVEVEVDSLLNEQPHAPITRAQASPAATTVLSLEVRRVNPFCLPRNPVVTRLLVPLYVPWQLTHSLFTFWHARMPRPPHNL